MPQRSKRPSLTQPKAPRQRHYDGSENPTRPAPPHNPSTRFLLTEYAHAWIADTLFIAVTTDVPVHLYLRWTDKPLRMHNRSTSLGGYGFMTDPKYCFVEWRQVEQNEPGDTLSHTFDFASWFECQRRWWGFVGTVGGTPSPSATCVFSAHYLDYERADSLKHTDLVEKEVAGVIDHADASITPAKLQQPPLQWEECQMMTYQVALDMTWSTITLPAWWPDDVVALDVQLENWDAVNTRNIGIREVGSAINRRTGMWPHTMVNWRVKVNAAHEFEMFAQDHNTGWIRIIARYR